MLVAAAWLAPADRALAQANWTVTKTPDPTTYSAAGQTITYTYVVTNNGTGADDDIYNISLTDNVVGAITCPKTTLTEGGDSMTCVASYTTTSTDVANGSVTNTVTANGEHSSDRVPTQISTQAIIQFVQPNGSITIVKAAQGGNGSFSFTSTIPGSTSFTLATSNGSASQTFSNLSPGTYTVTEVGLPLNWELASLTCTGDTGGLTTTVSLANRSVSIGLDGGEAITCTFTNRFNEELHRQLTLDVIRRFLAHRINLLANHEPDRARFIRRFLGSLWGDDDGADNGTVSSGPFSFTGTDSPFGSRLSFSTSLARITQAHADAEAQNELKRVMAYAGPLKAPPKRPIAPVNRFDIWTEIHYSQFRSDLGGVDNKGHFGVGYLGADYLLTPWMLVGALVQFDSMAERSTVRGSRVEGDGVMAGPYVSMRLSPNLFFDMRAAWGVSDNKVNPFGVYQDKFTTSRWLAHAKLTGNWRSGDVRVTPSAWITFIEENQRGYTDTIGVFIPGQTVSLGRFGFGPEFARRYTGANGTIYEAHVAVKGLWDFVKPNVLSVGGLLVSEEQFRALIEAGLLVRYGDRWNWRAVVKYDGIGSRSFHDIGAQVWLNFPLN
jgi:uncharacterized repeat protein (TIGR01451 family)